MRMSSTNSQDQFFCLLTIPVKGGSKKEKKTIPFKVGTKFRTTFIVRVGPGPPKLGPCLYFVYFSSCGKQENTDNKLKNEDAKDEQLLVGEFRDFYNFIGTKGVI